MADDKTIIPKDKPCEHLDKGGWGCLLLSQSNIDQGMPILYECVGIDSCVIASPPEWAASLPEKPGYLTRPKGITH